MLSITQQKILLALLRAGEPLTVRKLMEIAGIQYNIKSHLEYLNSLGLIVINSEEEFPRRKLIALTKRGLTVAKLLEQVVNTLDATEIRGRDQLVFSEM